MPESTTQYPPLSPDDLKRKLTTARPDTDQTLPHIGLVGDTYTITVSGEDTAGRFCVIDMHIPPGGGPAPHRHDFEETFILLDGEMEATFRGKKSVVRAGDTINIPANAPHPAAARLFMEWLLSEGYSKIVADDGSEPIRAGVPTRPDEPPLATQKVISLTVAEIRKGIPEVIEAWRDTFGN